MKPPILFLATTQALSVIASAQTTFFFHDSSDTILTGLLFDDAAGSVNDTNGGFILTAEALLDGTSLNNTFNGTSSSFGIDNSLTESGGNDDSDRFDNLGGLEVMQFSFNTAGTFQSIDLRFIEETSNEAVLIFDGGSTYELNTSTALSGDDDFSINESFSADQMITLRLSLSAASGENFGLESFTIVPEPKAYALLAGISALVYARLRRKKHSPH